jgi:formylglycine-generating enzyme required for sulfatase activity
LTIVSPWLAERGFRATSYQGVAVLLPPMVSVPAGDFLMGRVPGRDLPDLKGREAQHVVCTAAYTIGRFPVTVAEFSYFARAGGTAPANHGHSADWVSQLR